MPTFHVDCNKRKSNELHPPLSSDAHRRATWWGVSICIEERRIRTPVLPLSTDEWGRFLVSLREVINSERILACRSLFKEDVNFWKEDISKAKKINFQAIDECLERRRNEILEVHLNDKSSEVATTIAGYVARKLLKPKRCKCGECKIALTTHDADVKNDSYISLL